MQDLLFFIGLSLLFTHEMDAVKHREWRLLPGMWHLDDANGFLVFTAVHIPIYLLLFVGLFSGVEDVQQKLIIGLDFFFIIHVLLHVLLRNHPDHNFHTSFSWILIVGAGVAGTIDLLLS